MLRWLPLKGKIQAAADRTKAELEAERAGLSATLQARGSQIQGLNAALDKSNGDNARLQAEITSTSSKLADAEEKTTRIPTLEDETKAMDVDLASLNAEVTKLKETQAELNTIIQKVRK